MTARRDAAAPFVDREPVRVEPFDEFNRELVRQVHPSDWVNPAPRDRYHLVVIGGGTGGLVSAVGAASLGARAALIERHLMGGDCLNVGCVPSKAVIRAARSWRDAATSAAEFGGPAIAGPGDFGAAMRRMRRLRSGIAPHDGAPRFRDLGVDVFLGDGAFTGPDAIQVNGATLRFRRAVIATGARAAAPPIPGLEDAGYLTNESIFSLTELPEKLVVIGGGPIGCEMAQAFARFGSAVTLLHDRDEILPKDDPEAAAIVRRALERDGVTFHFGAHVQGVERRGDQRFVRFTHGQREATLPASQILVAVGRAPNVEGLNLEAAGVAHGRGGVLVNDRLRSSNPRIYAVGDVASRYQFTHAADAQARVVLANALFFGRSRASRLIIPWCTYTWPELAHVGMTHAEARSAGDAVDAITVSLADVDRAVLDGDEEGFLLVYVKRGTDRILGATLAAAHAGDMISELTLAMTAGLGLGKIGSAIHPYPTQAEVIRKAADAWRRTKLTPRTKKVLSLFFRVFR